MLQTLIQKIPAQVSKQYVCPRQPLEGLPAWLVCADCLEGMLLSNVPDKQELCWKAQVS